MLSFSRAIGFGRFLRAARILMLKPLRILLVDDDDSTLEVITLYLESGGHRVEARPGGEEALEAIKYFTFGLTSRWRE